MIFSIKKPAEAGYLYIQILTFGYRFRIYENMMIVWDEPKREQNLAKHGMDFADLSVEFFLDASIEPAKQGRSLAIGSLNGEIVIAVVFRPMGTEAISVISMRRASRKERSRYDQ